ncbi:MAG: glycosyltransferase [Elainellaceae cyanobacterium]
MPHIGLLCPTASGHLNPMTTLGRELRQRGHRVTLVAKLDARPKAEAACLEFEAIAESQFPVGSTTASLAQLGELSGTAAFRYTINLYKESSEALLREAPAVIDAAGIDFLLVDQTLRAGATVAQRLNIPYITVCCAMMLNPEPDVPPYSTAWRYYPTWWARWRNRGGYWLIGALTRPIRRVIAQYRTRWNLPPLGHPTDAYSELAQLCQQPAEFEYPRRALPDCFHFTGPYLDPASREPAPFPFDQLTGQPLIYASLGTVQNRLLPTFRTIAQACQGLDAQLVIALGGGGTAHTLPDLPGSPIVVGYAPQLELLQRAALTITHAGMNTVLESLSNGVPMVAIPIANDQHGVATRIEWTGTGEAIPLKELSVPKLRQAITTVLEQESYRRSALKLQAAIQAAGGVKRAADIVEQVIATGQPVLA